MKPGLPIALLALALSTPARARTPADFYRGKTLTLDVGFNPGGGYDVYARLFAKHFPRFLHPEGTPGAPSVVVRNMPGAGSVIASNHLASRAAADGTEFGLVASTAALEPLFGVTQTQYDGRDFVWLGSANREPGACFASAASGVASARDLFERGMLTGTAGTSSLLVPTTLNNVLGAKLKLVRGYAGTSALMLAIERGEVQGMCGMVQGALETEHPDWLTNGLVKPVLQIGLERWAGFGDAPLVTEFVKTPDDAQLLRLLIGWSIMGRPFLAPPKTPPERALFLRTAFAAMMADTEFRADARKSRAGIDPIGTADIAAFLQSAYATPRDIVDKARAITRESQ